MRTEATNRRLPELRPVRRLAAISLVAAIAAGLLAPSAPASPAAKPRVTIIGDSVMASFDYVPAARRTLGRGLDLRSDTAVCRRLVAASCPFQGTTPPTALDVIRTSARTLGSVVVINVGYNDWSAVYDVGRVVRELREAGVKRIVWVTLREAGVHAALYAQSNARIRAAARRWTDVVVADWNARSQGRSWFRGDGLHLTSAGALALAQLLRPLALAGAGSST